MTTFMRLKSDGSIINVRIIPSSALTKCPHFILVASHYREDLTCKCDDPEEQAMMIREWGYTKKDFAPRKKRS